jgi:hypothetical protein
MSVLYSKKTYFINRDGTFRCNQWWSGKYKEVDQTYLRLSFPTVIACRYGCDANLAGLTLGRKVNEGDRCQANEKAQLIRSIVLLSYNAHLCVCLNLRPDYPDFYSRSERVQEAGIKARGTAVDRLYASSFPITPVSNISTPIHYPISLPTTSHSLHLI